jgi:hypothetical protein
MPRKFWVILAFGALTYECEQRRVELDELQREATATGGRVGGLDQALELIAAAEERRSAIAELLPYGTPDDWVAVGSATLFDEYERKVREIGRKLDPAIADEDIPRLRRQVQAVCVAGAPPLDAREDIPTFTRDPDDDPIVFSALRGDVDLLISDDKDVVPDRRSQTYRHEDHRLLAVTFGVLVEDHIDAAWADIDGSWLAVAHERLRVGEGG